MIKREEELKIYEKLGIKKFKEFTINGRRILFNVIYNNSKEVEEVLKSPSNYNIDLSLEGVKNFKKEITYNSMIHLVGFIFSLGGIIISIALCFKKVLSSEIISLVIGMFASILGTYINGSCLVLQRYNYLRIEKILERAYSLEKSKEEKRKYNYIEERTFNIRRKETKFIPKKRILRK